VRVTIFVKTASISDLATIMGKLKVRAKTNEKKLVILLPHPLKGRPAA
jgi:hypothetical protein